MGPVRHGVEAVSRLAQQYSDAMYAVCHIQEIHMGDMAHQAANARGRMTHQPELRNQVAQLHVPGTAPKYDGAISGAAPDMAELRDPKRQGWPYRW